MFQSISFPGKFSLLSKTKHSIFGFTALKSSVWGKALANDFCCLQHFFSAISFNGAHAHTYKLLLQLAEKFHPHSLARDNESMWPLTFGWGPKGNGTQMQNKTNYRIQCHRWWKLPETIDMNFINHGFIVTSSPILHHPSRSDEWNMLNMPC